MAAPSQRGVQLNNTLLDRFFHILHQITGLALKNFTELHDGINRHAPVVYKAINRFRVDFVLITQIDLFNPFVLHKGK